jgi:hypothetical protein
LRGKTIYALLISVNKRKGKQMSVYEGMSMRGSGIYSYDTTVSFACGAELYAEDGYTQIGTCDFDGDTDGHVDDYSEISATCPKCGDEKELGNARDE